MRLLTLDENGQFSLTKDLIDNIPQYAILSHTWAEDEEEITFRDIIGDSGKAKSTTVGYRKLLFCQERATLDKLRYFWVDTCCIDKSNSVELIEAINSMFLWYQDAAKCYVYLSDISTGKHSSSQALWESAFRQSRWFTRGWTLQELIAPQSVEFFSKEGERLGDKELLEAQICEITGIPARAFRGNPLSDYSVAERMSWVAKRKTKRKEDKAYCLFGIFGIYMPTIYGEGENNAFQRLGEAIHKSSNGKPLALSLAR
jgi:Heterokaryon incompatibility protein (HET)